MTTGREGALRCRHVLVLGGARSGKSRYAEVLAERSALDLLYCATAVEQAEDREMAARIARHRADRGARWSTVEAPIELLPRLEAECGPTRLVLVDCLTLWLTNVMLADQDVDEACRMLAAGVPHLPGPVVFVSNEVGQGIVPENALARRFRDAQGRLNQAMAQACDSVVFLAAGLPLVLKPAPGPAVEIA